MYSHFDFKNLIRRSVKTLVPREFKYLLIGVVFIILLVLIASNMYLQEMLFFEGVEKSTPLFTEDELREYGAIYKELEIDFQNKIASYIQNYANRTNRKGEKIKWGVYGKNNSEDLINDDFVDGVEIKYIRTKGRSDGESNLKDILAAIAVLIDQRQSKGIESEDKKIKITNLFKELYNMSHTYQGKSSSLYPCTHGCFFDYYHCSDAMDNPVWDHCNVKYNPFSITPHEEYDDYHEEDFEIVDILGECEVCVEDNSKICYEKMGCVENGTCYHGDEEYHSIGDTEPTEDECSNWEAVYECTYDGEGEHDCSDSDIGCGGYYKCSGHVHYECPNGHYYICCMGHTNLTITVKVMYLEEIINTIREGYTVDE
ncbi:MAG: hypothetical protein IKP66_02265 [Lachnospiraceae bacterium]|nr:hypothetical protein [Lachnospiraceae bacterium]